MIIRNNTIKVEQIDKSLVLSIEDKNELYKNSLFFDLEHYVYKKPICIGVFGCSYYDDDKRELFVTQYMIEDKKDSEEIISKIEEYFIKYKNSYEKKYIVTFSGNNDFTVLRYLFKERNIYFDIDSEFIHIDLQKQYEKEKKEGIGLKNLEKIFEIERESAVISGSNLAKTISKIIKDKDYFSRMPEEKKDKILLYNEQDVVSLFYILTNWKKYIVHEE
ncbi:ribonuclease H-like domain-containing protein [Clostridium pasteurianum]|uniref:YprB ribonuclease H-like domain-containing protein n=1 Tax=Clostridium pasteurianum BC1 TaxID=86416 RepID=R4K4W1_CLOPA|nr:ribonuclease H-like domain-containing protein [Clostridium pasteurianum]AGK98202.1 hypothetical protein Clopa_3408 [Clostridium pasteurianum BC1]